MWFASRIAGLTESNSCQRSPLPKFCSAIFQSESPALRSPHGVLPRCLEPQEPVQRARPQREHPKEVERRELPADVKAAHSAAQKKREDARTANVSPETDRVQIAAAPVAKSKDEGMGASVAWV